jgi:hypothetical protein
VKNSGLDIEVSRFPLISAYYYSTSFMEPEKRKKNISEGSYGPTVQCFWVVLDLSKGRISCHVQLRENLEQMALFHLHILTFRALKNVFGDGDKNN